MIASGISEETGKGLDQALTKTLPLPNVSLSLLFLPLLSRCGSSSSRRQQQGEVDQRGRLLEARAGEGGRGAAEGCCRPARQGRRHCSRPSLPLSFLRLSSPSFSLLLLLTASLSPSSFRFPSFSHSPSFPRSALNLPLCLSLSYSPSPVSSVVLLSLFFVPLFDHHTRNRHTTTSPSPSLFLLLLLSPSRPTPQTIFQPMPCHQPC